MVQYENMIVSVIIPAYNAAETLGKCLDSLINQEYKDLDIVLVDDGSKDQTAEIGKEYVKKDRRIRYFYQKNHGVSAARNKGIQEALGKYICFVDSDDWVDSDYITILISNMNKGGLSVCNLTMDNDRKDEKWVKKLSVTQAQISVLAYPGMEGFPVNKMFDLALIRHNNIFFSEEITICEDVLFSICYLSFCDGSVIYSGTRPYHYIKTGNGATNSRFVLNKKMDEKKLSEVKALEECKRYILNSSELQKAWQTRYTKAAVNTLRTLAANQRMNHPLYKKLKYWVRKHSFMYLKSPYGASSSKLSVLLSAISPILELKVWRYKYGA